MATASEGPLSSSETAHELPPFTSDPSLAPYLRPVATCLASFPALQGLATGNLVIVGGVPPPAAGPGGSGPPASEPTRTPTSSPPRLLLVQRAPHDSMPLCWEVPGGAVDDEDSSVLHAAARELFEEAGLVATRFVAAVAGGGDAPEEFHTRSGRRMGKVSFLVDVAGAPGQQQQQPPQPGQVAGGGGIRVTLDPNEHVAFMWVTEEEARARRAGDVEITYTRQSQEDAILTAFRVWENLQSRSEPTL